MALRYAIEQVRKLDPAPVLIAPQHGGLIQGDLTEEILSRVEQLQVGVELLSGHATTGRYLEALNDIVDDLKIEPRAAMRAFLEHARSLVPDERFDELVERRRSRHDTHRGQTLAVRGIAKSSPAACDLERLFGGQQGVVPDR